jgi:hypothetical protein
MSWNIVAPAFFIVTWKNQHPPSGRTGDSTSWLFPLITFMAMLPSSPSGYAVGILEQQCLLGKEHWRIYTINVRLRAEFLIGWFLFRKL